MSFGQYSSTPKPASPTKPPKEKKLKAVFETSEVPHVFASPLKKDGSGYAQTHARNSQNNLFFNTSEDETRILLSYRESYPIASRFIVGNGKNAKPVFLVRSGKPYSVTTAQHMSQTAQAVRNNGEVFRVPFVVRYNHADLAKYGQEYPQSGKPDAATHKANLADYIERITEEVRQYTKARSAYRIESAHSEARKLTSETKQYAKTFSVKLPALPTIPKYDAQRVEDAKTRQARLDATKTEREAQRNAEALKLAEADIAAWKRGESITPSWGWNRLTPYALLRIVRNPEDSKSFVCETSQGVRVPIGGNNGAARLLRYLEALKQSGRTYHTNGHSEHIGQFTVTSFDGSILRAGCHSIRWEEVQSVAEDVRKAEEAEALAGIAWA